MRTTDPSILKYKFETSIDGIKAVLVFSLIFCFLFGMGQGSNFYRNPHFLICLVCGLLVWANLLLYSWTRQSINIAVLVLYFVLTCLEFTIWDVPVVSSDMGHSTAKGLFLDIWVSTIPFVYLGLRFVLLGPQLLSVYKLSLYEKSIGQK